MVNTTYEIEVLGALGDTRPDNLNQALSAELLRLGMHHTVRIVPVKCASTNGTAPAVGVYFASPSALADTRLTEQVSAALAAGRAVIPVVDDLSCFSAAVPTPLRPINGWPWSGANPEVHLAHFLLEQLGIEEAKRKVFISHKRDDGLMAAEQLRDALSKVRFDPFIDRFNISPGEEVQSKIADELENHAFMLVLETPWAHTSEWVYDEVDYALSHSMGILILRWPGDHPEVPGSPGLPRLILGEEDLQRNKHDYDELVDGALDRVLAEVEAAHAYGLVRRRRNLIRSIEDAAEEGGCRSTPLPDWRVRVDCPTSGQATLLGITPRLPAAEDLQVLDQARAELKEGSEAILVHAARRLGPELCRHLEWVAGNRELSLVPDYAIGSRWTP